MHSTLWNICYNASSFIFIDIIKGIVPEFLSDKICQITHDKEIILNILYIIYGKLYVNIKIFIWIPHCDFMLQKEVSAGITKKEKKKKKTTNINSNSFSFKNLAGENIFLKN